MNDAQQQDALKTTATCSCCASGTPGTITVTLTGTALPSGGTTFDGTYTLTQDPADPCKWTYTNPNPTGEPRRITLKLTVVGSSNIQVRIDVGLTPGYIWYVESFAKPFDCAAQHNIGPMDGKMPPTMSVDGGTARMN